VKKRKTAKAPPPPSRRMRNSKENQHPGGHLAPGSDGGKSSGNNRFCWPKTCKKGKWWGISPATCALWPQFDIQRCQSFCAIYRAHAKRGDLRRSRYHPLTTKKKNWTHPRSPFTKHRIHTNQVETERKTPAPGLQIVRLYSEKKNSGKKLLVFGGGFCFGFGG